MNTTLNRILTFTLIALAASSLSAQTVDQIIAKARGQLGAERKLKSVNTLQYHGSVLDAEGQPIGSMLLQFKRPDMQRLQLEQAELIDTTAVNGSEGWQERINKENPLLSGVRVLPPNQVRFLQANAYENLNFFLGPKQVRGGTISLEGSQEMRGKECWVVKFTYPSGLSYERYFDKATYKLVATVAGDNGYTMVENGSQQVNGIRFPKEVQTFEGDQLIRSVVFDKIEMNLPLEDSLFDFPGIPSGMPAAAKK